MGAVLPGSQPNVSLVLHDGPGFTRTQRTQPSPVAASISEMGIRGGPATLGPCVTLRVRGCQDRPPPGWDPDRSSRVSGWGCPGTARAPWPHSVCQPCPRLPSHVPRPGRLSLHHLTLRRQRGHRHSPKTGHWPNQALGHRRPVDPRKDSHKRDYVAENRWKEKPSGSFH